MYYLLKEYTYKDGDDDKVGFEREEYETLKGAVGKLLVKEDWVNWILAEKIDDWSVVRNKQ